MDKKSSSMAGLEANILTEEVFNREISMCKKLHRENGGKCCWGKCAECGVIPLLYKLRHGRLYEKEDEIRELKQDVFNS